MQIVYFGNDWFGENRTSSHHIARRLSVRFPLLYVETPGLRAPQATARDIRKLFRKVSKTFEQPRKIGPQMWHMTMPQIPFRGLPGVEKANLLFGMTRVRAALKEVGFTRPLSWFTVPHPGGLAGRLGECFSVYYCIDNYSALPDVDANSVARLDEGLSRRANLVFVCSSALLEAKRLLNPAVVFSPHGVDVELFAQAADRGQPAAALVQNAVRPVVGMFGLIDGRLDLALLKHLAHSRPQWTFVFVGRLASEMEELATFSNVILPGPVPYNSLPEWGRAFDICIMPYCSGPFAESANPLKMREYLASGKPVVSVPMPAAEPFVDYISIASTPAAFLAAMETELAEDSLQKQQRRIAAVAGSSWDARVDEVIATVERHRNSRSASALPMLRRAPQRQSEKAL